MFRDLSIYWAPLLPWWSIALIACVLLALLVQGSLLLRFRKQAPLRWIAYLAALRVVAIALLALALLQPTVTFVRSEILRPELLVLVDTSQSMGMAQSPQGRSRLDDVRTSLRRSGLIDSLSREFLLRWFAFDRRAYPIAATDLDGLQPRGPATRYASSLESAFDLLEANVVERESAANAQRVLLVSDGLDQGGEDLAEAARRLGVAVDTLGPPGSESQPQPMAAVIRRVQAPSRVLLGSEMTFLVTLAHGDPAEGDATLLVYEDGREVHEQKVTLRPSAGEQQARIVYRPAEPGLKRYELGLASAASGAPATADSKTARYTVDVQVVDDKVEVLVLEDRWRWEFKFLRRVLEDDPSFNFTAMLSRGGPTYVQFGEPERRVNLVGFPQSRAEIDWFDVIVLGDVHPGAWPRGLSGAIADAVIDGGKSLILVAGPGLDALTQIPQLQTLFPVELTRQSAVSIEGPIDVRLTAEGAQSPLFAGCGAGADRTLPAIDRIYPPVRKRFGATVLVEAVQQANASGPLIVVAEHTVGRGRVLYVGTDSLWKWQTLTPPDEHGLTLYGKFWQQALRALTPNRTAAYAGLWLEADRSRYETGSRVRLRAETFENQADDDLTLQATVVLPDERRVPLVMTPDPVAGGVFGAEFDATLPGQYRISLSALSHGQLRAEASTAVEAHDANTELDGASVDRSALARIAAGAGGKVIDPADSQTWPKAPDEQRPTVEETRRVNLWDNFTLIVALCVVLGGDWLLRLFRGFV
jgi:hypothetical protein